MASLKDIAKKAGTSIATVSLSLHGGAGSRRRVSPEKEALIKKIAEELNYAPDAAARMMLSRKSGQIGVVIRNAPDKPMHNPPNYEIIVGLADCLADSGYLPLVIPLKIAGGNLDDLSVFKERLLDGIVFTDCVPESVYEKIAKVQKACVFIESEWHPSNCIRRDEQGVGAMAVDHLLEAGCESVVYFGLEKSPTTHFSIIERRASVAARCEERGAKHTEVTVRRAPQNLQLPPRSAHPVAFHEEFLERTKCTAKELIELVAKEKRTLGIIAYNSIVAHAAYTVLAGEGFIAGRDYSLCSCDTCFEMELNWPDLACCEFNRYEAGKSAARMMLQILTENKAVHSLSIPSAWREGSTIIPKQGASI